VTEPCDLSATEARALIGTRRLSPLELTQSCIARIEAVDPAINAMVARDFDGALAAARAAEQQVMRGDALGPLHGLPLGVKDLIDAKGLPTTFGSPIFKDQIAKQDEGVVAKLRAAGAIVLGKTNTPEWGAGANTRNAVYGVTGNPFDPTRSAAGSSGGSGAALACGMVPIATGSDTGGSCRNPAAFCGIVGMRPTLGLIASERRNPTWIQFSTLGPMARTVSDLCLMFAAMIHEDGRDPLSTVMHGGTTRDVSAYASPQPVDLARLRVAITDDFGFAPTERMITETFRGKLVHLGKVFARMDEAHPDCAGADEAFATIRAMVFLGRHLELMRQHPDLIGPNVRANVEEGLGYSAQDVARALTLQTQLARRWHEFFGQYDIVLSPAITISPRPWRELYPAEIDGKPTKSYFHWLALAYAVTLAGHPAISLPVGLDRNGMPFGLQIVGPRGGDLQVLAVAAAVEQLLAGDGATTRPTPDIAKLKAAPAIAGMEGFLAFD
jgi:amidase